MITDNPDGKPDIAKYTALLTQTGTDAPTVTVLQNTTGATFTPTRLATGVYTLDTEEGTLPATKTTVQIGTGSSNDAIVSARWNGTDQIAIASTAAGNQVDGRLQKTMIEIRIYNENF